MRSVAEGRLELLEDGQVVARARVHSETKSVRVKYDAGVVVRLRLGRLLERLSVEE